MKLCSDDEDFCSVHLLAHNLSSDLASKIWEIEYFAVKETFHVKYCTCVPHNHGTSGKCPPGCLQTVKDCQICQGAGMIYFLSPQNQYVDYKILRKFRETCQHQLKSDKTSDKTCQICGGFDV